MTETPKPSFPKGWLKEQIQTAKEDVRQWPDWQKKALKVDMK